MLFTHCQVVVFTFLNLLVAIHLNVVNCDGGNGGSGNTTEGNKGRDVGACF